MGPVVASRMLVMVPVRARRQEQDFLMSSPFARTRADVQTLRSRSEPS